MSFKSRSPPRINQSWLGFGCFTKITGHLTNRLANLPNVRSSKALDTCSLVKWERRSRFQEGVGFKKGWISGRGEFQEEVNFRNGWISGRGVFQEGVDFG